MLLWKHARQTTQPAASLLAKPTPLNINFGSDRFAGSTTAGHLAKMKRILVVLFIVGFVYVDHVSGPLLPNDWYCILRAGTVFPESHTCEHKSLWMGWTRNEATDKLNKLIKEWEWK